MRAGRDVELAAEPAEARGSQETPLQYQKRERHRVFTAGADTCVDTCVDETLRALRCGRLIGVPDTACEKSVSGVEWAVQVEKRFEALGIPTRRIREEESFRFGPGKRVRSLYALLLPVQFGKSRRQTYLLRLSVVDRELPLLISQQVLSFLKMVIRFRDMTVAIGTESFSLLRLKSNHSPHL